MELASACALVVGAILIAIAAVLGALSIGARESETQRREVAGYAWKLFGSGVLFVALSVVLRLTR